MDGDVAPVDKLARLCADHGALLVLDEAHAVLGPHPDLDGVDHLRVGTLSKTLGSVGGFVAGTRRFVDLLVNRARPFIFTTAPAPADAAAALAALRVLRSAEGDAADRPPAPATSTHGRRPGHPSPIVPVILGDEQAALDASAALADRGLRRARHPPADGRPGNLPPAGQPVGRPHRRAGRTALIEALRALAS